MKLARETDFASWAPTRCSRVVCATASGRLAIAAAWALLALLGAAGRAQALPSDGIHNIQHVVVIMQENRSFDSYFGTYPGANGIPPGVCVPDPATHGCVKPFHNAKDKNFGGPHASQSARGDVDGGRMDGFMAQVEQAKKCTGIGEECGGCSTETHAQCEEVMSYHDAREIPNYWEYAHNFVLQDNMFESAGGGSGPAHLFMVSGWSAKCPANDPNPLDCANTLAVGTRSSFAWTDVTYLLAKAHVSWGYYVFEGTEPDCESDEAITCQPVGQSPKTPGIWNPLPNFTDVGQDGQLGNVQSLNNFYTAAHEQSKCGLPNVSWIVPGGGVSEHPPSLISKGQAFVTTLVNTVMKSPCWNSTAIFVSWDDWGGLYDHVVPPVIDENGYGLRVPGLVISPYAKTGYIDHQRLSHDSYLKFIEDDFLSGSRLNPATDGRPDRRPDVREEAPGLGDLANEFDFTQAPRPAVLLPTNPEPGPASNPPGGSPPTVQTEAASAVAQRSATLNATVNPNEGTVNDCHFEYGTTTAYGASVPCASLPGSGAQAVAVSAAAANLSPDATYHFRIVASNPGGSSAGSDRVLKTLPDMPVAQTMAASAVSQTAATLNATVNPNGAEVSDCHFEYGTTTAYGASVPCASPVGSGSSAVEVTAAVGGLGANSTYHFRIVAANAGGSSAGSDRTVTTLPNRPTVTTTPAGSIAQGAATLTATVNPNGGEVTDCHFEYGSTAAYGASVPCASPVGSGSSAVEVSAAVGGLSADSTYHFRIAAANAGGSSAGSDLSFATLPAPPTVEGAPASSVAQTSATLNATVNPNGGEVSDCHFEYGRSEAYGSTAPCSSLPRSGTSPAPVAATLSGLVPNSIYHFRIVATNAGGTGTELVDYTFTTLPEPPTAGAPAAASVTQTSAKLTATVNPHGVAVGDCHFEYGHSEAYEASMPCAAPPSGGNSAVEVSATVGGLSATSSYHFRIVAANAGGSGTSSDATFTTLPNPPSTTTTASGSIAQRTATLEGSVNPNGGEVSDCHFEYGTSTFYGSTQPCAQAPGSGTSPVEVSAALSGLVPNSTYHFRIVASNPGGTSYGGDQTLATLPEPPAVTALSPAMGAQGGGDPVTITGENLGAAGAVKFGTSEAQSFVVNSATSVTAVSPPGSGAVDVTVTTRGGTSAGVAAARFSYQPPPSVTKVVPLNGAAGGGNVVNITGANLGKATAVRFGSVPAQSFKAKSASSLSAISPPEPVGSVDVTVTTPGGTSPTSSNDRFGFTAVISALSPASGPTSGGTTVTVTGEAFAVGRKGTALRFGSARATSVTCASSTTCTVIAPPHEAGTVEVQAIVAGTTSQKSAGARFNYQ